MSRRLPRRVGLLALLLACAVTFVLLASASAFAATAWDVSSVHGPQNMTPGGVGQYNVFVFNVGDTDSDAGNPLVVTDTLPPGVIADGASGANWTCTGIGTGTVTCTYSGSIKAPAGDARWRGAVPVISIDVSVPAGLTGEWDNTVQACAGGGATVTATEPTPFNTDATLFGPVPGSFRSDVVDSSGDPERQAGAHPFEYQLDFDQSLALDQAPGTGARFTKPAGHLKTLKTLLPIGMIGNPQAVPQCKAIEVNNSGPATIGACPSNTQVGTADLVLQDGAWITTQAVTNAPDFGRDVPLYNITPPKGAAAAFAFTVNTLQIAIVARLARDAQGNYAIEATVDSTTEALLMRSVRLKLWGVPADPAHDGLRLDSGTSGAAVTFPGLPFSGAPIKPFLTLPSRCGTSVETSMTEDSWLHPGAFTPPVSSSPITMQGCDDGRFRFNPTITVQPQSHAAGAPSALDVDLSVPQKDDTVADATQLYSDSGNDAAIATPPLKSAVVTLPAGISVSPSSADGLAACTPLQVGLDNENDATCPDASAVGSVSIKTPLLPDPLTGKIYLASQTNNPFGSLLAIYLVAKGPGVIVKLAGKIEPDPVTGQLKTTFDSNPQLPFTDLHLRFAGGPRAALAMPPTCGTYTSSATLTSWNADLPPVRTSDSFTVDSNCAKTFDPTFTAGTSNPVAGKDSPLTTRFTRSDSDEELSKVDVSLPPGLLGHIADAVLCSNADANAGSCPDSSRIGQAVVAAGPGSNPFYITDGKVFITGPYKGAPFGLSIVVHAKAGPIDLGNVVVRTQIQIDRTTAALRVVSDPLPTILQGIPLQVRLVDVTVDRPGFTFNPTNCSEMKSTATLTSTGGKSSTESARFQVGDCATLPFAPKMKIRVGSRRHVGRGASTPLTAVVRMTPGQANLRGVRVTLPSTINARLPVINRACTLDEFHAGDCEKAKAGDAVATTPLLRDPLKGGVYFVRNGRSLPDMMVALRGTGRSAGVAVDLGAKVAIPHSKYLRTTFDAVPDVPITKFRMHLVSGSHGPVGAATNLCTKRARRARMGVTFTAQNGKTVHRKQRLGISGCKAKAKARKARKAKARAKARKTHEARRGTAGRR